MRHENRNAAPGRMFRLKMHRGKRPGESLSIALELSSDPGLPAAGDVAAWWRLMGSLGGRFSDASRGKRALLQRASLERVATNGFMRRALNSCFDS
jgi:hypothetical protein